MITANNGKLAILTPGMGAVATTLFAGVEAVKKGLAQPIGSLTQTGKIKPNDESQIHVLIKDLVPLYDLENIVFGAWDIFPDNAYESALHAKVLEKDLIEQLKQPLEKIKPMKAVFDSNYVKRLSGPHVKSGKNKMDLAKQLRQDIKDFIADNKCDRAVLVWCASTEVYSPASSVHTSLAKFEEGLINNAEEISPSQIYAYAALKENVPYANGSPNVSVELPFLTELSKMNKVPISGSDFKTGQTLIKTVLAPALRHRQIGVHGWFSTNILGNRDGEVLDDPGSFKSKEVTKSGVLDSILDPDAYPELYGKIHHVVKINYYLPRGDNKEGWDNIDIFGWLGYPMQIKVNFLCRDSILAAPLVLDLALFMDLSHRAGYSGPQDWLSFYYKMPLTTENQKVDHDLFNQYRKLEGKIQQLSQMKK